ncbi:MAG: hypothetical protein DI536_23485 [Archangium gephyra]|uniref:Uncharacterized protein n=1 Tax=Archangium gephyra TaxID=48 RepID=A0A2W5SZF8_9BACT|nr:MAG: hypothetical protein DI536_23485 [Archangium gephyra]
MNARVDKQWKDKGLTGYSTEAIIGTLNHYGVKLDEAGFKATAADKFPLDLAIEWKPTWKGTGQFAPYPYAAANELFNRLLPEKPTPMKTAHVILDVIANGLRAVAGRDDANLAGAFGHWDALVPNLPPRGDRRDAFLRELVTFLESWAQTFNELPERLAKAGKKDEALKVALVHEVLFTDREGCMTAIVRAHSGEREAAVGDLSKWAGEAGRDVYQRYSALDALFQLEELEKVKTLGLGVFDAAAEDKKWGLADSIAHLLGHLVQKAGGEPEFVRAVRERLDRAHAHTGGHH